MNTTPIHRWTFAEGAGNTFAIAHSNQIPQGTEAVAHTVQQARQQLHRQIDSVLLLEPHGPATYTMHVLEADGSVSVFCGNGSRAAGAYWHAISGATHQRLMSTIGSTLVRVAPHGHIGQVESSLPMQPRLHGSSEINGHTVHWADIGEPHACVVAAADQADTLLQELGPRLANGIDTPGGTYNFNVITPLSGNSIAVRTWERGVHAETQSCGTGSMCSSMVALQQGIISGDIITVKTNGGTLRIAFPEQRTLLVGPASVDTPWQPADAADAYIALAAQ